MSFVSYPQTLEAVFVQITSTNVCDLVMSIIIIIVVFIVKELNERFKARLPVPIPIEVIVVSVVRRRPFFCARAGPDSKDSNSRFPFFSADGHSLRSVVWL